MFSALKKLAGGREGGAGSAPAPLPSSLQKKFSRGVHYNMKILIKGDRNVGKSCLLRRLQGGPFIEEYVPTEQIQAAAIHWTYKTSDHIVKVDVWEVVDKARTKKKAPLGLKLDNLSSTDNTADAWEIPALDATFLDVYKDANGVILMMDITKPWTFEYVVKEVNSVPADLPLVLLGNHCDMQHHRQVHPHHIEQVLHQARQNRSAPVRYAESSMRNGFGLRLLHKFLNVPFLRLQRNSLLQLLQKNQKDIEDVEKEIDEFQNCDESNYNLFVERLASKRRQSSADAPVRPSSDNSPSIVLGAGKPIIPPNVNPLMAHSLNPMGIKAQQAISEPSQYSQSHYVNSELIVPEQQVSFETTPPRMLHESATRTSGARGVASAGGDLDEFYAGALDTSFLDDSTAPTVQEQLGAAGLDSDSENENTINPMVTNAQDDLDDIDYRSTTSPFTQKAQTTSPSENSKDKKPEGLIHSSRHSSKEMERFMSNLNLNKERRNAERRKSDDSDKMVGLVDMESQFELWTGTARRSPEGGEDPPIVSADPLNLKEEKKHRKSKKLSKEKGDGDKSERKEKKHKHKKSHKSDKTSSSHPQKNLLLSPDEEQACVEEDYDSI